MSAITEQATVCIGCGTKGTDENPLFLTPWGLIHDACDNDCWG